MIVLVELDVVDWVLLLESVVLPPKMIILPPTVLDSFALSSVDVEVLVTRLYVHSLPQAIVFFTAISRLHQKL